MTANLFWSYLATVCTVAVVSLIVRVKKTRDLKLFLVLCLLIHIVSLGFLVLLSGLSWFSLYGAISSSIALVCFIMSFPAIVKEIPSVLILETIRRNPGLSKSQLVSRLVPILAEESERQIASDGLLKKSDQEGIAITGFGRFLARLFLSYRKMLNLRGDLG